MELLELVNGFNKILDIEKVEGAQQKLMTVLFNCDKREKLFDEWLGFCPDLKKDYMQMIFQYYFADRKKLGQDYTPVCLGNLLSELCSSKENDTITDLCCGSGSLIIQQWNKNKNIITCDVYVENCKKAVPIALDVVNNKLDDYTLPEGYEWCRSHIIHAKQSLLSMDRENKLVNETTVMWY